MKKFRDLIEEKIYPNIKFDIFKNKWILASLVLIFIILSLLSFLVVGRYVAIPGLIFVIFASIIFGMDGGTISAAWLSLLLMNSYFQNPESRMDMDFGNPFLLSILSIFVIAFALGKSIEIITSQKQKLSQSQKRFNSVVQTQKEMICRFEPDTTLTFVNEAYCKQFDMKEDELIDRKFIELIPEDEHNDVFEKIKNITPENPTQTYSHKVIYGEANTAYQEWTDYGIFDENGNIIEIQSVGRDITAEKKAEEKLKLAKEEMEKAKNRYKGLVESQNDLIVRVDTENKFTYVNDVYCRTFGKSREELLGSSFQPLVHPDDLEKTMKAMEGLTKPPYRIYVEQRAKTVDGWRWISWEDNAIRNNEGEIIEIQGVGRDITELKIAQKDAEKANKMKSLFLANISHEIRTPLNVIVGFTEILEKEELDPEYKKYLKSIKIASDSLLSLINDILDISKIESDVFEVKNEFINLKETADEVKSLLKEKTTVKGLEFKLELFSENILISFDRDIIRRILINLINNAVKFTDKGYVKLTLSLENIDKQNKSADLKIMVEDTGIGISKEKQEDVFEPFTQIRGSKIKQKGTGLGLTITRRLVQQLGGSIELESSRDEGSKFTMVFPERDFRKKAAQKKEIKIDNNIGDYKILVVDDEELNRELLRIKLEKRGIKVAEAENGFEAYKKTIKNNPNLVLMDLKMPEEDGYSGLKRIKKDDKNQQIKIIALSAAATKEEKEKAETAGFDDFITKPITDQKLNNLFSKYISN